jgi:hypothetical protein
LISIAATIVGVIRDVRQAALDPYRGAGNLLPAVRRT